MYCNSEGNLTASPQSKGTSKLSQVKKYYQIIFFPTELLIITIALCLVLLLTIATVIWLAFNQLSANN